MDEQENEQFCEMIGGEVQQILLDGTMNMRNKVVVLDTSLVESRFKDYLESFTELYKSYDTTRNKKQSRKKKTKTKQRKLMIEQSPHPDPIGWAKFCRPIFPDMRPCYYATVAVVYDWTKNGILIKTLADWPNWLSPVMWGLIRKFNFGYKEKTLRTALLNVKKDLLDNCQPREQSKTGRKRGRPKEHSEDKVKAAKTLFDELQGEGTSVNECWLEVSTRLGFKSPAAAKQAVYRLNK